MNTPPRFYDVSVRFYRPEEGGRSVLPDLGSKLYRPHFVITGQTDYLGVVFVEGKSTQEQRSFVASVASVYETVDYSSLVPGVHFLIMEGAKAVGEGLVMEAGSFRTLR